MLEKQERKQQTERDIEMVPRQTISRENTRVELHAQIQHAGVHRTHFFILSKTLLNNAIREPETIRVKQTRPQER